MRIDLTGCQAVVGVGLDQYLRIMCYQPIRVRYCFFVFLGRTHVVTYKTQIGIHGVSCQFQIFLVQINRQRRIQLVVILAHIRHEQRIVAIFLTYMLQQFILHTLRQVRIAFVLEERKVRQHLGAYLRIETSEVFVRIIMRRIEFQGRDAVGLEQVFDKLLITRRFKDRHHVR